MRAWLLVLLVSSLALVGAGRAQGATMSVEVQLDLFFDPIVDEIDLGQSFYRPTVVYYDGVSPAYFQMNLASYIGDVLPSAHYTQTFWSTIPDFPAPSPSTTVYGGFFAYYSYCDGYLESCDGELSDLHREGMFVGLRPDFAPVSPFDDEFGSEYPTLSEQSALETMKTPGPSPFDVLDEVFYPIYINDPGLLPTWHYDPSTDAYTLEMNIWGYSDPLPAGSARMTAQFAEVSAPAPGGLLLLLPSLLALVPLRRGRARRRSTVVW